jgi:hypothetical protein
MGAWGTGNFDNDEALDWLYLLSEAPDLLLLQTTLEAVTGSEEDYLDATDCAQALAAAEIIAALAGHPPEELPEEAAGWLDGRPAPPDDLKMLALIAIEAVAGEDSELRELWEESDEFEEWQAVLNDLTARLKA